MSKKIELTQGKYAIVDDEDFIFINRLNWYAYKSIETNNWYARAKFSTQNMRSEVSTHLEMPRLLINTQGKHGYRVHHKNGDTLDNRKDNLILVPFHTTAHKSRARTLYRGKPVTSKYKGVWRASRKSYKDNKVRYLAGITKNKKIYLLGTFIDEEKAALAYNEKAKELYGELAYQNKI
jgi:hypothetical protein